MHDFICILQDSIVILQCYYSKFTNTPMIHANYITFDLAWYSILSQYSASIRRNVCDAVLNFATTGERPALKGLAKLAFELISHEISKQMNKEIEDVTIQPEIRPEDNESTPQELATEPVDTPSMDGTDPLPDECPKHEPQPEGKCEDILPPGESSDEPQSHENKETAPIPQNGSQEKHSHSALHKPCNQTGNTHHISKNIGKVTCRRKGDKIIFRRR